MLCAANDAWAQTLPNEQKQNRTSDAEEHYTTRRCSIAWSAVPAVIPVIEEIFFRGLFYRALEKRWGIKGAILGGGFMFACVHLQLIGFFTYFASA
jgi:membrane protease YdiL (CAAX protease family)